MTLAYTVLRNLLIGLLSSLLSQGVTAAPELRVGLFSMAPFYSPQADGQASGELIGPLDRVLSHLGYTWTPVFMPVPDTIQSILSGEVDLLMIIRHPQVEGKAEYSRFPVSTLNLRVFRHQQTPAVSSLSDLRFRRVALIDGYGYVGMLSQLQAPSYGLAISTASGSEDAFRQLDAGRVDYVLDYRKPGNLVVDRLGLRQVTSDSLWEKPVFFVASQQVNRELNLIQQLDKALLELGLVKGAL